MIYANILFSSLYLSLLFSSGLVELLTLNHKPNSMGEDAVAKAYGIFIFSFFYIVISNPVLLLTAYKFRKKEVILKANKALTVMNGIMFFVALLVAQSLFSK